MLLVLLAHRPHQEIKHRLGVFATDVVVAAVKRAGAVIHADVAQHAVAGNLGEVVRLVLVKLRLVHYRQALACLQVVEDAIGRVNLPHVVWMAACQLYVRRGTPHLRTGKPAFAQLAVDRGSVVLARSQTVSGGNLDCGLGTGETLAGLARGGVLDGSDTGKLVIADNARAFIGAGLALGVVAQFSQGAIDRGLALANKSSGGIDDGVTATMRRGFQFCDQFNDD